MKNQFIGMSVKQRVRIKMQTMYIDIFSNSDLQELAGGCFSFFKNEAHSAKSFSAKINNCLMNCF